MSSYQRRKDLRREARELGLTPQQVADRRAFIAHIRAQRKRIQQEMEEYL